MSLNDNNSLYSIIWDWTKILGFERCMQSMENGQRLI